MSTDVTNETIIRAIPTLSLPPIGRTSAGNSTPEARYSQPDGMETIDTNDDQRVYECMWLGNLRHGPATSYHAGRRVHEVTFVAGRRQGIERIWNVLGKRVYEANWLADQLHGPVFWFADNGTTLLCEMSFNNGRRIVILYKNCGRDACTSRGINLESQYNIDMVTKLVVDVIVENTRATAEIRAIRSGVATSLLAPSESGDGLRRRATTSNGSMAASAAAAAAAAVASIAGSGARLSRPSSAYLGDSVSTASVSGASETSGRYSARGEGSSSSLNGRSSSFIGGGGGGGSGIQHVRTDDEGSTSTSSGSGPSGVIASTSSRPGSTVLAARDTPDLRKLQLGDLSLADYYAVADEHNRRTAAAERRFSPPASPTRAGARSPARSASPGPGARAAAMLQLVVADPNDSFVLQLTQEDGPGGGGTATTTADGNESPDEDPIMAQLAATNRAQHASSSTARVKQIFSRRGSTGGGSPRSSNDSLSRKDKKKDKKDKEKKGKK